MAIVQQRQYLLDDEEGNQYYSIDSQVSKANVGNMPLSFHDVGSKYDSYEDQTDCQSEDDSEYSCFLHFNVFNLLKSQQYKY